MTKQAITIHDEYSSHPGDTGNWSTVVEYRIEDGSVRIFDWFGNGQSMESYLGRSRNIGYNESASFGSVEPLVELLQGNEAQALMAEIAEGYSVEWNGHNHVGRLTDSAKEAEEALERLIASCWEYLPTVWTAEEWFGGASIWGELALREVEEHGSIEEAASSNVLNASPEYYLNQYDLEKYLDKELRLLAEGDDETLAARAKKFL